MKDIIGRKSIIILMCVPLLLASYLAVFMKGIGLTGLVSFVLFCSFLSLVFGITFFKVITFDTYSIKSIAILNPFAKKIRIEYGDIEKIVFNTNYDSARTLLSIFTTKVQYDIYVFLISSEQKKLIEYIEKRNISFEVL